MQFGFPLHPIPNQPREQNFGTDLHSFMDGLYRIVQILYLSIPTLSFIKLLFKYTWKFCIHLGQTTVGSFSSSIASYQIMENIWLQQKPRSWRSMGKYFVMVSVGLFLGWIYMRKKEEKTLQYLWDQTQQEELQDKNSLVFVQGEFVSEEFPYIEESFDYVFSN